MDCEKRFEKGGCAKCESQKILRSTNEGDSIYCVDKELFILRSKGSDEWRAVPFSRQSLRDIGKRLAEVKGPRIPKS